MNYKNKIVLVTGGANGIGKSITAAYAKAGATVIMADIDKEQGEKLATIYQNQGYKVFFYPIDLQHVQHIQHMFEEVSDEHGNVQILINNAGLSKFKPFFTLTVEEWDEVLNVNLRGMVFAAQAFAKQNQGTSYGRIVNIASTRAFMSEPHSEAYAASKGGIVALTHALAISLSKEHITVNSISPGWIQTDHYEELAEQDHEQHPSLRVGRPEDIVNACLFLTDEKNDFINGENIIIDGGMTKKMIYTE
ncbi:SDR family oxidoreductase [Ectobacillus sp. JY-23]|uniref:SDR family NAD(P)-dependent oxidoreductase n=1 Tax=Ectobacillus sp. JY-23 TaxID=2933872 RepID=UPI001FF2DD37|nr:SDR family oxidoreductase [Ectobacillus sp. JY-23]UOY93058.1 SDR family oxidoreductase [Ectobacillus sp. JY-23]